MAHKHEYIIHQAAGVFPMLSDPELLALGKDISKNGQRSPIQLWKGALVDGRNRLAACLLVGIDPTVEEVDFNSEEECVRYIISTNIHRRHLTESQRMMIASKLAQLGPGGDHKSNAQICALTQSEAADQMQVSRRGVQMAKKVSEEAPDLAAKVMSGEMKVSKAASIARERTKVVEPSTDINNAADSVIEEDIDPSLDRRFDVINSIKSPTNVKWELVSDGKNRRQVKEEKARLEQLVADESKIGCKGRSKIRPEGGAKSGHLGGVAARA